MSTSVGPFKLAQKDEYRSKKYMKLLSLKIITHMPLRLLQLIRTIYKYSIYIFFYNYLLCILHFVYYLVVFRFYKDLNMRSPDNIFHSFIT